MLGTRFGVLNRPSPRVTRVREYVCRGRRPKVLCLMLPGIWALIVLPPANARAAATVTFDPLLSLCLATHPAIVPATFWTFWSLAPEIILPLVVALALYARSMSARGGFGAYPLRAAAFFGGWLLLVVALDSPLCWLAASLAWAHMVQHVILVAAAPPLLVLGVPPAGARPMRLRRYPIPPEAVHWPQDPVLVGVLYMAIIWLAHVPVIYQAALSDPLIHLSLIALLLFISLQFWSIALQPSANPSKSQSASTATGILLCFFAMIPTGILGALLVFSHIVWYPLLASRAAVWDWPALQDQQLAGVIMWMPMGAIYLCAGFGLMLRWLNSMDGDTARRSGSFAEPRPR